jgi:hypothetical protein
MDRPRALSNLWNNIHLQILEIDWQVCAECVGRADGNPILISKIVLELFINSANHPRIDSVSIERTGELAD